MTVKLYSLTAIRLISLAYFYLAEILYIQAVRIKKLSVKGEHKRCNKTFTGSQMFNQESILQTH
jgi:hypothetical protein